ncbi:PH domain-containing protein [Streptomyces sp. TverLS-915]|uniref:PH domain-containing protein n=2 Tax=unclassified Streptomyces TaxID=2593676 RepID=UPI00351E22C8
MPAGQYEGPYEAPPPNPHEPTPPGPHEPPPPGPYEPPPPGPYEPPPPGPYAKTPPAAPTHAVPVLLTGPEPRSERRLHPLTPLRRAWAPVAVILGWAVHDPNGTYRQLSALATGTLVLASLGVILVACVYGVLSWWVTWFAVTESELRIRSGVLFRRTAHIRLDRLQAVDVTRPLLGRLAGVAKLKLDVVGAKSRDELAYLAEAEARVLRAELLARAAGGAVRGPDEAERRVLWRVAPGQLAGSVLLSGGLFGSLCGAAFVSWLLWTASHSLWSIAVTAVPIVGGAATKLFRAYANAYDWTVGESPDGLRLDHGLLETAHETVPPGRVQSVRLVEPLLWRAFGWVRVELHVAGSQNSVLVPVAPYAAGRALVARVLPGTGVPEPVRPPARARWRLAWWWRGQGLAVDGHLFVARQGVLRRTTSLVPHAKVQSVHFTQGPWERALGLASLAVDHGANGTVRARARAADEARTVFHAQAARSRTSRKASPPAQWPRERP